MDIKLVNIKIENTIEEPMLTASISSTSDLELEKSDSATTQASTSSISQSDSLSALSNWTNSQHLDQIDTIIENHSFVNSPKINSTTDLYSSDECRQSPAFLETMTNTNLLESQFLSSFPNTLPTNMLSLSPTPSSTSSLSLPTDIDSNANLFNRSYYNMCSTRELINEHSNSAPQGIWNSHNNPCLGSTNPKSIDSFQCLYNDIGYNSKQEKSVGTDLSINRDLRCKKDFQWLQNFKLPVQSSPTEYATQGYHHKNTRYEDNFLSNYNSSVRNKSDVSQFKKSSTESFKLVEKIQPKKSRTKYSKEHISYLEAAYEENQYPDIILIENLCRILSISKEKINIWFQNRRARHKRCYKTKKDTPNNSKSSTNTSPTQINENNLIALSPKFSNFQNFHQNSSSNFQLIENSNNHHGMLNQHHELTSSYVNNMNYASQFFGPSSGLSLQTNNPSYSSSSTTSFNNLYDL